MATDRDFWDRIASYENTLRHHHGRLAPSGGRRGAMDCVGPAFRACWDLGLDCPEFTDYAEQPDPEVLRRALAERAERRQWKEWSHVGRLLLLTGPIIVREGQPAFHSVHVAYMGPDRFAASIERKWRLFAVDPRTVESVWLMRGLVATQ